MTKKFTFYIFLLVFAISALELIFYFFYIYKPVQKIAGTDKSYLIEFPTVSQILSPSQLTTDSISFEDHLKTFNTQKGINFLESAGRDLSGENTFVKAVNLDSIVGGEVVTFDKDKNNTLKITLTNSTKTRIVKVFNLADWQNAKTDLVLLSPVSPSRIPATLDDTRPGDYLIIKKSVNLLTEDTLYIFEFEIIRGS